MRRGNIYFEPPGKFGFYGSFGSPLYRGGWAVTDDMLSLCGARLGFVTQPLNYVDSNGQIPTMSAVESKCDLVDAILKQLASIETGTVTHIQVPPNLAVALCLSGLITESNVKNAQESEDGIEIPEVKIQGRVYTIYIVDGEFKHKLIGPAGIINIAA